jgi:hypothetical protein
MIGSRIWYLILAAAGAAALAAALLGQAAFNRLYDHQLTDQLRRDRFEIELLLRMDARSRIDAIAPLAANPDVRSALRSASARRNPNEVDADTRRALTTKLQALNGQLEGMAADVLFAVDHRGYIIGAHGGSDELPPGAGLGGFPLVERTLAGYVRDDTWVYNDVVYRMAARPVIDNGQYVGAIVHGMRLDDELARRLSERLGDATVAFFRGETLLGSHMPSIEGAPQGDEVSSGLGEALLDERLREGHRTDPVNLGGGSSRGVYSLVTGTAAYSEVGYAIARPRSVITSPLHLFDKVANEDVAHLPWVLIGGFFVVGFFLAMLFVWLERDRPVGKLRRASEALAEGKLERFELGGHGGAFRKIAQNVNAAIDKAIEAAGPSGPGRRPADLDEILGPSPDDAPSGNAFFGFAGGGNDDSIPPAPGMQAPPASAPKPPGLPGPAPHRPPEKLAPPAPSPFAAPPGPVPAGPGPRPAAPRPPAPVAAPPLMPPPAAKPSPPAAAPNKPDWAKGMLMGVGADDGGVGDGPYQATSSLSDPIDDDEDVSTTVAQVPHELLAGMGGDDAHEEDRHFREVYEKFVETKRACNESTTGLTFEKFSGTLKKNRDQIISRHGASRVRFTVYVKAGKAALKATPVK